MFYISKDKKLKKDACIKFQAHLFCGMQMCWSLVKTTILSLGKGVKVEGQRVTLVSMPWRHRSKTLTFCNDYFRH